MENTFKDIIKLNLILFSIILRKINKNVDKYNLVWHTDYSNRFIIFISGYKSFMLQYDNMSPIKINFFHYIRKDLYHRVIKLNNNRNLNMIIFEF